MVSTAVDRRAGLSANAGIKGPCVLASTVNLALSGLVAVDGVTAADGDRILVRAQTDARENGIYIATTGLWQRAKDFAQSNDMASGGLVYVSGGNSLADNLFAITFTGTADIGSTLFTIDAFAVPGLALKADIASPTFTGIPSGPTAAPGTNSTQLATTAFVQAGFQPLDADLTSLAALATTAYGRGFLVLADAAAGRTALALGTAAVLDAGTATGNLKTLNADGGFTLATTATTTDVSGAFGGTWKTASRHISTDAATAAGARATAAFIRQVTGSGTNGQANSDYAGHFEATKNSYLTSAVQGEIDVLELVGRQSVNGDLGGILINLGRVESASYGAVGIEMASQWVQATTGTVLKDIHTTINSHSPATDMRSLGFGFSARADTGAVGKAFMAIENGGTWEKAFSASSALAAGNEFFYVTATGHADGAGRLRVGAGSAAFPSLSFVVDTDSGGWRKSANTLAFGTNGAEVIEIATTGVTVTGTAKLGDSASPKLQALYGGNATATWTSIAAQTTQAQTVTVTGAATGDLVVISPNNSFASGALGVTGRITSADTLTISITNPTTGPINPGSQTFKYLIVRIT
jgi:hypothetical protein